MIHVLIFASHANSENYLASYQRTFPDLFVVYTHALNTRPSYHQVNKIYLLLVRSADFLHSFFFSNPLQLLSDGYQLWPVPGTGVEI